MWPYIVFAGIFSAAATLETPFRKPNPLMVGLAALLMVFGIGLRFRVGPDWVSYLYLLDGAAHLQSWQDFRDVGEPLYALLLVISTKAGMGIYLANVVTAAVFAFGLLSYIRTVPNPWTAFMAAVPNLILTVANSANRQTLAIGILLYTFSKWYQLSTRTRVILIVLAGGFHYSALIALLFLGSAARLPIWVRAVLACVLLYVVYATLSAGEAVEYYNRTYISGNSAEAQSPGALAHIAFSAGPALLYFLLPRYRDALFPTALLRQMAWVALAMIPLALFASTVASRLSFYWYPVALQVFGTLPALFPPKLRRTVSLAASSLAMFAMIGWLSFANMSEYFLPYRNVLFVSPNEVANDSYLR